MMVGASNVAVRSRYAPGAATLEQIVKAAETVLINRGYVGLTLRSVSEACGLKVGNLSYYFPTKRDLVRALMKSLQVFALDTAIAQVPPPTYEALLAAMSGHVLANGEVVGLGHADPDAPPPPPRPFN